MSDAVDRPMNDEPQAAEVLGLPAESPPKLRRLPGRGRRLAQSFFTRDRQRLYLASDHLLCVRNDGWVETHKKFYFDDVQAITVQTNAEATVAGALFFAMTSGILTLGIAISSQVANFGTGVWITVFIAAPFGLLLALNLLRGPTCTVRLHTAVQIEELTALRRVRTARKCIAILGPTIRETQGNWPGESGARALLPENAVRATANDPHQRKTKPKIIGATLHTVAFSLVILGGITALADSLYMYAVKNMFDSVLFMASMAILFAAVVRQAQSTIPSTAKQMAWAALIFESAAFMIVIFILGLIQGFSSATQSGPTFPATELLSFTEMDLWLQVCSVFVGVVSIVLGGLGLAALRGYRIVQKGQSQSSGVGGSAAP